MHLLGRPWWQGYEKKRNNSKISGRNKRRRHRTSQDPEAQRGEVKVASRLGKLQVQARVAAAKEKDRLRKRKERQVEKEAGPDMFECDGFECL